MMLLKCWIYDEPAYLQQKGLVTRQPYQDLQTVYILLSVVSISGTYLSQEFLFKTKFYIKIRTIFIKPEF